MSPKPAAACCAILAASLTLSGCSARPVGSETLNAAMAEMHRTLPTASVNDTRQTQIEVGTHRAVFFALCGLFEIDCQQH